jgi:hypothetical protein
VDRIAPLEQRRPGELGLGVLVSGEDAFLLEPVAGAHMRAVPPPLLAAEDHVLAIDMTDTSLVVAVSIVERDHHRLRTDQIAELGLFGEALVPVDRIDIVHRHDPAADVGFVDRLEQLRPADLLTEPLDDIADFHFDGVGGIGHGDLLVGLGR